MTMTINETRAEASARAKRAAHPEKGRPRHRRVTAPDLQGLLHHIPAMGLDELGETWRAWLPGPLPPIRSAVILRRLVAWRLQAEVHGGYDPATARALRKLIADHRAARPAAVVAGSPRLQPGTVLRREWKGRIHVVTVEAKGFRYEEETYASLSEIARLVTGTRWSGPRLFGLDATSTALARRKRS